MRMLFWLSLCLPTHKKTHLSCPAVLHRSRLESPYQMTVGHELCYHVFIFLSQPVHLFSLDESGQQSRLLCPVMKYTIAWPLQTQREINDILISNILHFCAPLNSCQCHCTKILLHIFRDMQGALYSLINGTNSKMVHALHLLRY